MHRPRRRKQPAQRREDDERHYARLGEREQVAPVGRKRHCAMCQALRHDGDLIAFGASLRAKRSDPERFTHTLDCFASLAMTNLVSLPCLTRLRGSRSEEHTSELQSLMRLS